MANTMNVQGCVCGNERRFIFKLGTVTVVFTWVFFLLMPMPLPVDLVWTLLTLYIIKVGLAGECRYEISDEGIMINSPVRQYRKRFSWHDIRKIEKVRLPYNRAARGGREMYFVVTTDPKGVIEESFYENMRDKELLCIEVTPETESALNAYCLMYKNIRWENSR